MNVLGIEIGGTKLQVAIGTREGRILELRAVAAEPERGARGILGQVESLVDTLLDESTADRPKAIGVGFGGPVESETGTVLVSHQVEGWEDIALRPWFEERFALPCRVENDSNAAGWAEFKIGAGHGARSMVYMNIGSGIGGAVVVDGRLYNGQGRGAGEIGHIWVTDLWAGLDAPGAPDKLENLCSAWSIERRFRDLAAIPRGTPLHNSTGGEASNITGPILAEAATAGDPLVLDHLNRIAEMLGMAIANVIDILHPERYVVGGGFAQIGEPLFNRLRATVDHRVIGPFRGRCEILPAQLEQNVVLAGALLLAPADGAC